MKFTLVAVLATLALLGNAMAEDDFSKKVLDSLEKFVDPSCAAEFKSAIGELATTYENSAKVGKKLDVNSLIKHAKNFNLKAFKKCFVNVGLGLKKSLEAYAQKLG